jgi:methyltransferase (TIGR00027 family)
MSIDPAANPIRNVSDTALWVAVYRAMESERPDALFHDSYARRLAGARGEAIVASMPQGKSMSWPLVVRTVVMDEILQRCLRDGVKTVLNLAAGLDARPYRLDLPASLNWLHVDMPEMVAYFRERMASETPRCRVEFIEADLRSAEKRREVFAHASALGPLLVITEGLLIYLEADQVADLARDLHDVALAKWWLLDLASPMLLKFLERQWAPQVRDGNAPFIFGPADGTAFFTPFGWREAEFRSTWDESFRLNRTMRGAYLWRWLFKLQSAKRREAGRRMSGLVLLDRT